MFLKVIIIYLVCILVIGFYSAKKIQNISGFYIADRKLGLLATTSTLTATTIGGSAIIASTIYVYTIGLPGLWMNLAAAIGLIALGFTFSGNVRKMNVNSLPELTGKLYNEKARLLASILTIISEIAWLALSIQATQLILTTVTGLSTTTALYLSTGVFIVYTLFGGQYAVAYSDVLQFGIMIFGVLLMATPVVLIKSNFLSGLSGEIIRFPVNTKFTFSNLMSMLFLMGLPHMVGSDVYSKLLSAKDELTAKRAAYLSGFFRVIFGIAVALIGLGALVLLPGLEHPTQIIPRIITELLPEPVAAFVLAAFVSTMMSSADTVLLTATVVFANDIYVGKKKLLVGRISVIVFGILGLCLALYLKDLIKTLELAYTFFASGVIIPVIAGFYKNKLKINSTGALSAMIGGGLTAIVLKTGKIGLDAILVGMSVSFLLIFFGSWAKDLYLCVRGKKQNIENP